MPIYYCIVLIRLLNESKFYFCFQLEFILGVANFYFNEFKLLLNQVCIFFIVIKLLIAKRFEFYLFFIS